jgi:hypothetical protein
VALGRTEQKGSFLAAQTFWEARSRSASLVEHFEDEVVLELLVFFEVTVLFGSMMRPEQ